MAAHWLREIHLQNGSPYAGYAFYSKMLCWWLYNVLGYTNFAQSVSSGSYDPTGAATGTNGALSNANFNLVDSTYGAFSSGDIGKWVLIKDLTNPLNSGWYKITAFVDANTVTIDFRSGPSEYPTTASGLSWWMIAEDASVPNTVGDYWRLRTPHTDGWELEVELNSDTSGGLLHIRLSLNADWTGSGKILGDVLMGHDSQNDASQFYWYAEGDTEGSHLHVYWHGTSGGNRLWSIGKVAPYETSPTHPASELWALAGAGSSPSYTSQLIDRNAGWTPRVWRERDASNNTASVIEWGYNGGAEGFTQWGSNEANARTGKTDIRPGVDLAVDYLNASDKYELIGVMGGLEECRNNFSKMQTLDDAGTKDKVHVRDGILLPWPGVTVQFIP